MSSELTGPRRGASGDTYEQGSLWEAVLAKDWSSTSLGPIEGWPITLRTILRTVLSSKQAICFWWGPDLLQFHNEAFLPILADRADTALGAPARELWSDVWDDIEPLIRQALSGEGVTVEDLPLQMLRYGAMNPTTWTFSYSPLYDDDGEIAGVMNITTETTSVVENRRRDRVKADELTVALEDAQDEIDQQRESARMRLVVQRELSHRLKNAYALVQSIVSQTLRHATSMEEASETVGARIKALSLAQDALTASSSAEVEISTVVRAALTPHQETASRIELAGPQLLLEGQQGLGVALAVHELATNAAKYGALSVGTGSVRVAWSCEGDVFRFEWTETGGPPATPPTRQGFGSRLLKRVVPAYFSGSATFDYLESGFRYALTGSLGDVLEPSI